MDTSTIVEIVRVTESYN